MMPCRLPDKLYPHLLLLVVREHVDNTVDGAGRILGMQSSQDQVTGLGGRNGGTDSFRVTHFAYQDDVRIFTEAGPEAAGKALGIAAYFPLVNDGINMDCAYIR
jgi:hypothetical protein